MKGFVQNIIKPIFFALFLLVVQYLNAQVYTIDDVPNVHLQDANAYVSDPERKLSEECVNELNSYLRFFDDSLDIQCAIIVLPEIDDEAYIFAHDLLNKWGVGSAETNRGLVILLVYGYGAGSQRDIYIGTGYGLEGDLPDAFCKHVQNETMLPFFKEERFEEGLLEGVKHLQQILVDEYEYNAMQEIVDKEDAEATVVGIVLLLLYFIIGVVVYVFIARKQVKALSDNKNPYKAYINSAVPIAGCLAVFFLPMAIVYWIFIGRKKREFRNKYLVCENCGSKNMSKPTSEIVRKAQPSKKGIKQYRFLCEDCKHIHVEEVFIPYVAPSSSSSSSSSSWSSSSRSSSGGSWGGGSSGGGGAGSRF